MTITLPYQFEYDGFLFGNGTPFQVLDVDGLESQPDLRVQDTPRGYADGYLTGRDFFNGRTLTFTLNIFAGNGNSAQQNWLLFKQQMQPVQQLTPNNPTADGNGALSFLLDPADTKKSMSARVRARKAKVDPEFTFGFIRAQLEMFAPDYRYYTLAATSASLTPQLANGRIYNRTYNLVYTQALAGNAAATATINNSTGTAATGPYIVITGPVTNPQITNLATGSYIQLVGNFAAADTVVIDMTNNTVTRNNSNIRNLMTGGSQFFTVPAATSQQVYFSAATNTGWANVWYRPAFA